MGVYNAQITNVGFQGALSLPPTTTGGSITLTPGFGSNPNSLSGSLPGLGRYYLDGTGNVVGMSAASSTTPAVTSNVGTYSVNVDCSGNVKLTNGAAYDIFVASDGTLITDVRTDSTGGGEQGILRRAASCVTLNYPGNYTFAINGGTKQTPTGGTSGTYAYSATGTLNLNGSGSFTMAETLVTASGAARSTSTGSYTVGADCSVNLTFSTASGANSTSFVAPNSFRFLMTDASSGLLSVQPDSATTLTGTLSAQ
jgi:hypothetical protein